MLTAILASAAAAPVLAMLAAFDLEMLLGQFKQREPTAPTNQSWKTVILVPAHNEQAAIATMVNHTRDCMPDGCTILVVADNCSDDTAEIARQAGAQVVERTDPVNRGKGFALAKGRDAMRAEPPSCVVIMDADCLAEEGAIARLVETAMAHSLPVQAAYLLRPDLTGSVVNQISNFAFFVKNRVRQRGLSRMGSAVLTGSGMAIPWDRFAEVPLASSDIVEDLSLGLTFAEAGYPVLFSDSATVLSESAPSSSDTLTQRRRWEHGFVRTGWGRAFRMARAAFTQRRPGLLALAAHMIVPPLSLLLLLACVQLAILWLAPVPMTLFGLHGGLTVAACLLVAISWLREGRSYLKASGVAGLPLYILAKIPSYIALLVKPETRWTRTKRKGE